MSYLKNYIIKESEDYRFVFYSIKYINGYEIRSFSFEGHNRLSYMSIYFPINHFKYDKLIRYSNYLVHKMPYIIYIQMPYNRDIINIIILNR
jgi:hypothetical protein